MKKLILFIHGLGGDEKTWGEFPAIINNDSSFETYDTKIYKYPTSLIRSKSIISLMAKPFVAILPYIGLASLITPQSKLPKIQDISAGLKTDIENRYHDYDEIYIVAHSMGGLVARKYLIDSIKESNSVGKVKKLLMYAVPHNGSDLAAISKIYPHEQIEQLGKNSDFIDFLNSESKSTNFESFLSVKYVVGTLDKIVDKQSALSYWSNTQSESVHKDHRGIVKPESNEDISFIILKKFIMDEGENRPPSLQNITSKTSLVLFDSFSIENQPYYLQREVDKTIQDILNYKNIWIHGSPGVGKTNCAQYYFLSNKKNFYHTVYFTTVENSANNYLNIMYEELIQKIGVDTISVAAGSPISTKISKVICYLATHYSTSTIYLDELSDLGEEEIKTFFISFIDIIVNIREGCSLNNVNFIITTLFNPSDYISKIDNKSYTDKIDSKFEFIEMKDWTNEELTQLCQLISKGLEIDIPDIDDIIINSDHKPRKIKDFIKKNIVNGGN